MPEPGAPKLDVIHLLTLGEISELISQSHCLEQTFDNIVRKIQTRFDTDVCSVYIADKKSGELVLSATVGLRHECVGCVRLKVGEGLSGLVAKTGKPINLEDAPSHESYRYFPVTGEEEYHSYLGVPVMQGSEIQGVLVVQHKDVRKYSENEVRLLSGIAAQLAIVMTNARLTNELSAAIHSEATVEANPKVVSATDRLLGTSASPGLAYGRAMRFEIFDFGKPDWVSRPARTIAEEKDLLAAALEKSRYEINLASNHLANMLGDQFGQILQAQALMLQDSTVRKGLLERIEQGKSVEQAVVEVATGYLRQFQKLENPFFYERVYDIKDTFRRLLENATESATRGSQVESVIVVAQEVSLIELFACDLARVKGIVVEKGGNYSHVAILARSMRIPLITQVSRLLTSVNDDDELFIDAAAGVVYVNPEAERRRMLVDLVANVVPETIATVEGDSAIRIEATVNLLPEVARTVQFGGDGVGLFRSEFLELARRAFPTEEEQLDVYRRMAKMMEGKPVTVRTLDLRPEKIFSLAEKKAGQLWDWRLVNTLTHVQDLIRTQIRAILRAAKEGPIRILFPMITSERQLRCALGILEQAKETLTRDGLAFDPSVPVAFMVEVPAAAVMVPKWASMVSFVGVGSNDLLHSLMGLDRMDDQLRGLNNPLEPFFLRTMRHIIRSSHLTGRFVTICGEAASNLPAALALFSLGADCLSVPPEHIGNMRRLFAGLVPPPQVNRLRNKLTSAAEPDEVLALLQEAYPHRAEMIAHKPTVTSALA